MANSSILALDMASHTGWAFRCADGSIQSGTALFLGTLNRGGRWLRFEDWLKTLPAKLIVYEEPFVHFKHRQGLGLGYGFEAILRLHCARNEIRCVGVSNSALKKWATGDGAASKDKMLRFAQSMGWSISDYDECDARWLLEYAIKRIVKSKG